jgi:hypothetical protein
LDMKKGWQGVGLEAAWVGVELGCCNIEGRVWGNGSWKWVRLGLRFNLEERSFN